MITAKIIGATGYGGVGAIELLLRHEHVQLTTLVATAEVGKPISALYPHLTGCCDLPIEAADSEAARAPADVVFFATPDRVAMQFAERELSQGAKVIDFSGDFRFGDAARYADYATRMGKAPDHLAPDLLAEAVYGLPELNRENLTGATRLVGNVGCFAMACLLGLMPAVSAELIDPATIICDCKTGVSGAGKTPRPAFHFPARQDQINACRRA